MNKGIFLGLLLALNFTSHAQSKDSIRINNLQSQFEQLAHKQDSIARLIQAQLDTTKKKSETPPASSSCSVNGAGWVFPLLPVVLFIGALFWVAQRLKKQGFELRDALSSYRTQKKVLTARNLAPDGTLTGESTSEESSDQPVRSTSRLVAFLTAITALIIAIVITSYEGFLMVSGCGKNISLDDLWKILMALGIGIIPYGANVLSGNSKEDTAKPIAP